MYGIKVFLITFFFISIPIMAGMGGFKSSGKQFNINLLAGVNQGQGLIDGTGGNAKFLTAQRLAINSSGHLILADNITVRKVVVSGTTGTVTTIAGGNLGGNNGNGVNAEFGNLSGIVVDGSDNIYVGCMYYCEPIRKIDTSANVTDLFLGSSYYNPDALAMSSSGLFYVMYDCAIYKVTSAGVTTFFAGQYGNCGGADGVSTTAQFSWGVKLYYHNPTNELYVADPNNYAIRKINVSGTVSTFAGLIGSQGSTNGVSMTARFSYPRGITYDSSLGAFFVADSGMIRKITTSGTVTLLTGQTFDDRIITDGTSVTARINGAVDILSNGSGTLYFTDSEKAVRKVDSSGNVTTLAGVMSGSFSTVDGTGTSARFGSVESVTKDSSGNLYIVESPISHKIRKVTPNGVVTTYGDTGCWAQDSRVLYHSNGNIYFTCYADYRIKKMNASGTVTVFSGDGTQGITDGASSTARFYFITGMREAPDGSIYVSDECSIRKVTTSGSVSTVAGIPNVCDRTKGAISSARFEFISDLVLDSLGNIYASERYAALVSKITSSTVSIFVSNYDQGGFANGTGTAAQFGQIDGMTIDTRDNIYVHDYFDNYAIRKITSAGVVTTPIGRKVGPIPPFQKGLQLGPLPSSINQQTKIIYDRNKLFMISPGGIFMAPAN